MVYKIEFMPTYLKYKYIFRHFELRSEPEPDFFLAELDPNPRNFFYSHPCRIVGT